ncbi:hypothetical protein [Sporosarcina limicola]|uniref:Uncharacterized protein n=1 Tax=Sporosarcina limicola TaxID=34101 RepID=A0A927MKT3_9BACL|nr:hypothetical protein [Sporosarcina limicola]MBE1554772.1 hypothetical protein [Sporosarcina limicola]
MPDLIVLEDSDENKVLLDPKFRERLTMISNIKEKHGIDLLNYDSFEDYMTAYLSSMDTKVLECMKHCLDSSGISDEVLDAVLEARLTNTTMLAASI